MQNNIFKYEKYKKDKMDGKVELGIAGCGPRGKQMARIAKLLPECCVLTAMSDPDEAALAESQFLQSSLHVRLQSEFSHKLSITLKLQRGV